MTDFNQELKVLPIPEACDEARQAAAALGVSQLHLAARTAGLDNCLESLEVFTLSNMDSQVSEALRAPFPSPFVQALRSDAGYPQGVHTAPDAQRWSLTLGEADPDQEYDTGVRLLCVKDVQAEAGKLIQVPLDITVVERFYYHRYERPDRVGVEVGERQLSSSIMLQSDSAQRLLIVASRFLELIKSGEAAKLTPPPPLPLPVPPVKQSALKRFFAGS